MEIIPSKWLKANKDIGILLLRIFIGSRLIYGVIDNILSWEHMMNFAQFLEANHFPLPTASAILSVYAQFIAGLMIITGFQIRISSILMIINFSIAIVMVHSNDSIEGMTPALAMLFCNILFLFTGAGRYSVSKEP